MLELMVQGNLANINKLQVKLKENSAEFQKRLQEKDKQVQRLDAALKDEKEKNARPPIEELDFANVDSLSFNSDDFGDDLVLTSARGDSNQNIQQVDIAAAEFNHPANAASNILDAVNQPEDENQIVPAAPAIGVFSTDFVAPVNSLSFPTNVVSQVNIFNVSMDVCNDSQLLVNPFEYSKKRKPELECSNTSGRLMITNSDDSNMNGELVVFGASANSSTEITRCSQKSKRARRKSSTNVKHTLTKP